VQDEEVNMEELSKDEGASEGQNEEAEVKKRQLTLRLQS